MENKSAASIAKIEEKLRELVELAQKEAENAEGFDEHWALKMVSASVHKPSGQKNQIQISLSWPDLTICSVTSALSRFIDLGTEVINNIHKVRIDEYKGKVPEKITLTVKGGKDSSVTISGAEDYFFHLMMAKKP